MALAIENLTLAHRRDIVVHEFSLNCLEGDVLALVRPNGAGEPTLLRALFGTHRPVSGGISYMPQDNSANGSLVTQGRPSDVITSDLLRSVYGVESTIQNGPDGQVWVRVESAVAE